MSEASLKAMEESLIGRNDYGIPEERGDAAAKLQSGEGPQKMDIKYILRRTAYWQSSRLSDGCLGRLYQAADKAVDKDVDKTHESEEGDFKFAVLKVQNKKVLDMIPDEEALQELAKISHPNIASLRGYVFDAQSTETSRKSDIAVFIYEFGEGNLDTHLSDNFLASKLLWRSRLEIVQGLLRAIHYLHSMELFHRFIQPAYIFLTPEGELAILSYSPILPFFSAGRPKIDQIIL